MIGNEKVIKWKSANEMDFSIRPMKQMIEFLEKWNYCKNRVAVRPLAVHPLALIPLALIPLALIPPPHNTHIHMHTDILVDETPDISSDKKNFLVVHSTEVLHGKEKKSGV